MSFNKIMWKNMVELGGQTAIWRTPNTCQIPKSTNTHSEYVIFIAFPPQRWQHENALMLRHSTSQYVILRHSTSHHVTSRHSKSQHTRTEFDHHIIASSKRVITNRLNRQCNCNTETFRSCSNVNFNVKFDMVYLRQLNGAAVGEYIQL